MRTTNVVISWQNDLIKNIKDCIKINMFLGIQHSYIHRKRDTQWGKNQLHFNLFR